MHIRKADLKDCEKLTELRIAMRRERESRTIENPKSFRKETFRYFAENIANQSFVAFIAEESVEVAATSGILFYRVPPTLDNRSGRIAYIMNMYTRPAYRRRGIAGRLLNFLVEEARQRGCSKLTLNASEMGKTVYEKFGFTDVENDMICYI